MIILKIKNKYFIIYKIINLNLPPPHHRIKLSRLIDNFYKRLIVNRDYYRYVTRLIKLISL